MSAILFCLFFLAANASFAATTIPFTINMSKAVNVTGIPRIPIDVGGNPDGNAHYATYASGTGTSTLTFNYAAIAGDVDLDGVTLSSPIQLNGGTIKDLNGNDATLTFTVPNTSNVKVNYPSLSMDFIADRYVLNGTVYNSLASFLAPAGGTFTRASTATHFNSSGVLTTAASGAPRCDCDPLTLAAKGILIEESRQNLLLQSNSFTIAPWDTTTCGGITNSGSTTTAPDGNSVPIYNFSNTACVFQDVAIANGSAYTHSIWIKANQSATIGFRNPGSATFTSTNISVGTTWQRYIVTATSTQTTSRFLIDNRSAQGYGVAGLQLSFFGGQIELGPFVTSYIPTTTTAVTRQADVLTIPTGSWFNATDGVVTAEAFNGVDASTVGILAIDNSGASGSDRITLIRTGTNGLEGMSRVANIAQFQEILTSNGNGSLNKMGLAYKTNDFRFSVNSTLSALDTTGTVPTVNRLQLGMWASGNQYNGWIQKIKYYPLRVTDTQLQLLTQ